AVERGRHGRARRAPRRLRRPAARRSDARRRGRPADFPRRGRASGAGLRRRGTGGAGGVGCAAEGGVLIQPRLRAPYPFAPTFSATASRTSALNASASTVSPSRARRELLGSARIPRADVERRPRPAAETGVDQPRRILERRAPGESQLDIVLVDLARAQDPGMLPYRHTARV